jgi:hypothetical protein
VYFGLPGVDAFIRPVDRIYVLLPFLAPVLMFVIQISPEK